MTTSQAPDPTAAATYQPAPLPANWIVAPADPPHKFVVVIVNDAAGQRVLFLDPDTAVRVADMVVQASRQARSGLVIPGGSVPPLNGQGGPT